MLSQRLDSWGTGARGRGTYPRGEGGGFGPAWLEGGEGVPINPPSHLFPIYTYIYFQINMDCNLNDLKEEIQGVKEETEEEKIDIENHFHPSISSCEEDHQPR